MKGVINVVMQPPLFEHTHLVARELVPRDHEDVDRRNKCGDDGDS